MLKGLDKIYILIPAYNPDKRLLELCDKLNKLGFSRILVVDDGSAPASKPVLSALKAEGITVLHHLRNRGKGMALKTGFLRLKQYDDWQYVITVDCDGQHKPNDILDIAKFALSSYGACVLGAREFTESVPLKSRIGNIATRKAARFALGLTLTDTQTGLRALPKSALDILINTKGERFEYEMNMLINLKNAGYEIAERPITTVYANNNSGTHFKALTDSIRILWVFVRFTASSIISFSVDIALFSLFSHLLHNAFANSHILIATVGARLISASLNFMINRRIFTAGKKSARQLAGYFTLMFCQMCASALLVSAVSYILPQITPPLIKAAVDFMLFFVSFKVQRDYIFKKD